MSRPHVLFPWIAAGIAVLVTIVPFSAQAGLASFSVEVKDELRVADVTVVEKDGVTYIPLSALVGQIGGGCSVTPDRVQVDLTGKTAWLKLGDARVSASLADFALSKPLIQQDNDALIALSDVAPFFSQAFRLVMKQDGAPPPTPLPATPEGEAAVPAPPTPPAEPTPAEPARPVQRPIENIILDPGHGGNDAGCEGPAGLKENALSLAVAQKAAKILQKTAGIKVHVTREKDHDLSIHDRIGIAKKNQGDLFVSIHASATFTQTARGFQIFCCAAPAAEGDKPKPASVPGAEYTEVSSKVADSVAAAVAETTGMEKGGIHAIPCFMLASLPMPSFLIELGFLTNPAEEAILQSEEGQDKAAEGLAAGISRYIDASKKGAPTQ